MEDFPTLFFATMDTNGPFEKENVNSFNDRNDFIHTECIIHYDVTG